MKKYFLSEILAMLIFISISFIFCKHEPENGNEEERKSFKPTGDLSDLVHNPVRADGSIDSSFLPIMTFPDTVFDFGVINEGDVVKKDFPFKNTGTAPLLIINATSTCGCTVPEWPEEKIPPDGTGVIVVKFDSKNKEGAQNKQVTIFANTFPNRSIITVKGKVIKSN